MENDDEDFLVMEDHAATPWESKLTEVIKTKDVHNPQNVVDPYDVDEDMEALLGYDTFLPKEHSCYRAIVVGPNEDINDTYANALSASDAFQLVETCTNPAELPSLLKNHTDERDVAVFVLSGFRGPLRITLFHSMQLYTYQRQYSDFSMIYAGATNGAAWTMVLAREDNEDVPYKNKWMYLYFLKTDN